jgi:hydroxyacylglutathione hydrolase
MIFQRIKSEGLAHNSYFVGSGSGAVVIDPRRDVDIYLKLAAEHETPVRYILETHRNEDYVSGSLQLASETGAAIFHGEGLEWGYGELLEDGQEFAVGRLKLTAIKTPGHTDESMSYVLEDTRSGHSPVMLFSGDTLFVGDCGRVDLYGPSEVKRLAGALYDSLFRRLLPLGEGVILCPAHGAGSLCGADIADRDESALGTEKKLNPSLQSVDKGQFVARKAAERLELPPYFKQMETLNLAGPPLLKSLPRPGALSAQDFARMQEQGAAVLDASMPGSFAGAHVRGSLNVWLEGMAYFPGWFLKYGQPIILVLPEATDLNTAVTYLVRLGYDQIAGYLRGGVEGWYNAALPIETTGVLSVSQLKRKIDRGEDLTVLDVRDEAEWQSGHIEGSRHIYVGHLPQRLGEISRDKPVAVLCSVGHRASVGASLLQLNGFTEVSTVLGSVTAWRHAGYPLAQD